jgi:hypothetical protein
MFNRNSSAGTAAEKRSKCSLLARLPLLLAILLLSAVYCQAQITINDSLATSANIKSLTGLSLNDSCWYESKRDTVNVDFIITIDENNFVKKEKVDYIIHKYQSKKCRFYNVGYDFSQSRIDTFLVNNKPVEILLYKPKEFNYLLVGNIR